MASSQPSFTMPADLALLHAIVRRDLPAVERTLAGGAELRWKGIAALHVCALCDWAAPVRLLLDHGARACLPCFESVTTWLACPELCASPLCPTPAQTPRLCAGADVDARLALLGAHSADESAVIARLETLAIPEYLCTAALPLHEHKTPLALAVRCGAVGVVPALLAAGASIVDAFP